VPGLYGIGAVCTAGKTGRIDSVFSSDRNMCLICKVGLERTYSIEPHRKMGLSYIIEERKCEIPIFLTNSS
jgi:hypothetical protein